MKIILILFLVFIIGCGNQNDKWDKVKPEQAKQVIVDFLYAGNQSDFEKMKNLTTSDFLMYGDEGEMDLDELVQFIKDWPEPDKYNFGEFEFAIQTDYNSAFVNYYYGPTGIEKDSIDIDLYNLHSIYIKRVGNELKIDFIHSNRTTKGAIAKTGKYGTMEE